MSGLAGLCPSSRTSPLLIASLRDIDEYGVPQLPKDPYARPDGQVVAPVFPADGWDGLLFMRFTAEVWMQPGVTLDNLRENQAAFYREESPKGALALVLGAGQSRLDRADGCALQALRGGPGGHPEDEPGQRVPRPVHRRGVRGAPRAWLFPGRLRGCHRRRTTFARIPLVEEIHITGSDKTHDAIVYGVGEEGARRKASNEPPQHQAAQQRAWQRESHHHRPWPVVAKETWTIRASISPPHCATTPGSTA